LAQDTERRQTKQFFLYQKLTRDDKCVGFTLSEIDGITHTHLYQYCIGDDKCVCFTLSEIDCITHTHTRARVSVLYVHNPFRSSILEQ